MHRRIVDSLGTFARRLFHRVDADPELLAHDSALRMPRFVVRWHLPLPVARPWRRFTPPAAALAPSLVRALALALALGLGIAAPAPARTAIASTSVARMAAAPLQAHPTPGDCNGDGARNAGDFSALILEMFDGDGQDATNAGAGTYAGNRFGCDPNKDSLITAADLPCDVLRIFNGPTACGLISLTSVNPANGESNVSPTRETILTLDGAIDATTVTSNTVFAAFAGQHIPARQQIGSDGKTVFLFYDNPLPSSARVRLTLDGDVLRDFTGEPMDILGAGTAAGTQLIDFDTLSTTRIPGTDVWGYVFDSYNKNPNNTDRPVVGATIRVDAFPEANTTTDASGYFILHDMPVPEFFVHIDGTTATNAPTGTVYANVGKPFHSVPGRSVQLEMDGMPFNVFLPPMAMSDMTTLSTTQPTAVNFGASGIAELVAMFPTVPITRWNDVTVTIPVSAAINEDGLPATQAVIIPVPPDRIPAPLAPGLEFPLVISVQAVGATNFDVPVPACFPNLPDPTTGITATAGSKEALYSFDHDKGEWKAVGGMTVSADGQLVCTNPGVGILAPGWHGWWPPTVNPVPRKSPSTCGGSQLLSVLTKTGSNGRQADVLASERSVPNLTQAPPCSCNAENDKQKCNNALAIGAAACIAASQVAIVRCAFPPFVVQFDKCAIGVAAILAACTALKAGVWAWCRSQVQPQCGGPSTYHTVEQYDNSIPSLVHGTSSGDPIVDSIAQKQQEVLDLVIPYISSGQPVPESVIAQVQSIVHETDVIAGGDAIGYLTNYEMQLEATYLLSNGSLLERVGSAPPYPVKFRALIWRPNSDEELRGQTQANGEYSLFVPRDGKVARVEFYDPHDRTYGIASLPFLPQELPQLPRVVMLPVSADYLESDNDGLVDLAEIVVGTSLSDPDSDNDGVLDGAEVDAGTDPLDGLPAATGIVASADTPGTAVDVCALNDIAAVADSAAGVSLFSVGAGTNPVAVARVNTPGSAERVACAGNNLAVADGAAGLAIIDVTDPPAASIVSQLNLGGSTRAVVTAGGLAFVGLGSGPGTIAIVDLDQRALLRHLTITEPINDLALGDDYLYALSDHTLFTIRLRDLVVTGTANSPAPIDPNTRLFVGGGIAYVTQGKGYNTFSLASPQQPQLITASNTNQFGWKQIVANGTGLGVAAVGINGQGSERDIWLYDTSNPSQTDEFLTLFETPGIARAVSIYNGLAYVADSDMGMHVINYLPYDAFGVPPTITLHTNFAPGFLEEGQLTQLTASVGDDVQLRNVEFYIGGQKVATDGNFPFEYRFTAPLLSQQSVVTVTARAADTGGNTTSTSVLTLTVVADATQPTVTTQSPLAGANLGDNNQVKSVTATFSEPISVTTLSTSSFQVIAPGPDTLFGTGDDITLTGGTVDYADELKTAILTFPNPFPVGSYRAVVHNTVKDLKGNSLAADFLWVFNVKPTTYWDGGGDGTSWSQAANWSGDVLPASGNAVVIDVPGNVTVTFSSISIALVSLTSAETLVVNSGSLDLAGSSSLNALTFNGGTITGAGSIGVYGPFTWASGGWGGSGTTYLNGPSTFTTSGAKSVNRSIINNGTVTMTGSGGLGIFAGKTFTNNAGATFEIQAAGILMTGGTTGRFENLGTFRKSTSAGEAQIWDTTFNNSGTVEVTAGTLTFVGGSGTHTGPFNAAGNAIAFAHNGSPEVWTFNAGANITAKDFYVTIGLVMVNSTYNVTGTTGAYGGQLVINSAPTSLGTVDISNAALTLNYASQTFNAPTNLAGTGFLGGTANFVMNAPLNWTGGALGGTGVMTANAPITMSTSAGHSLVRYLVNNSTFTMIPGATNMGIGAGKTLTNSVGATFEVKVAGVFMTGGGDGRFENLGTFRKSTNVGEGQIWDTAFNNSGTVEVTAGTLSFVGGSGVHTGSFNAAGNAIAFGHNASPEVWTFNAGADITAKDFFVGRGLVTVNSTYNVTGTTSVYGGQLVINAAPTSLGTVDISSAALTLNYASQTFNTPTNLAGTGFLGGSANFVMNAPLNWTGGALGGTGVATANAPITMSTSGGHSLVRYLVNNSTFTMIPGATNMGIGAGKTLTNSVGATFEVKVAGVFMTGGGDGRFENLGTFRKSTNVGEGQIWDTAFNNSGTVEVTAGTLSFVGGSGSHTGPFNAAGNVIAFGHNASPEVWTFNAGADITAKDFFVGRGLVTVNSTYNVTGTTSVYGGQLVINAAPTSLGTVDISSAALTLNYASQTFNTPTNLAGTGFLGGSANFVMNAPLNWSGGTLGGTGLTTVNAPLSVTGAGVVLSRNLINNGVATTTGAGWVNIGAAKVVTNSVGATWQLQSTFGMYGNDTGRFENQGTFRKAVNAGVADVNNAVFNNSGTVEVLAGTLLFINHNLTQSAGLTNLSGGNLSFTGGATLQLNGGDLAGAGTVTGNLTNNGGRVLPGGDGTAGTLSLAGNYTQGAAGTLKVDIGGLTVGTQYDRLSLPSNTATLTGTLDIAIINSFTPSLGNTFDVVAYSSKTGTFGTTNGTAIPGGNQFQVNYPTGKVQLQVVP